MTLIDGEKNGVYLVKGMNVEQSVFQMRLKSIGVTDGSHVKVIGKKEHGGLIIQLGKKQIALCRNLASGIVVEFEKKEFSEVM
ncbi:FeoA family protein [Butyrivibrio sp. AE3006]|uniref:FeoA family protein n=1 Tax=Butyrivibrio sp. AE3006 TaxID=1280673 RepID=UPI0004289709|nr:FeoA family protein [Butyrivibrio sp. AE3006]